MFFRVFITVVSINISLLLSETKSYELVLGDIEVRAAQDALPFLRNLTDNGPQSLVLVNEDLFVSSNAQILLEGNETFDSNWNVTWKVMVGDKEFKQGVVTGIKEDGVVKLRSENGFFSDVNWVHVTRRGDQEITVVAELLGEEVSKSTTVFAITSFESVLPLIVLILLAILSRNVYIAMFFGIWTGTLVISGGDIAESFRTLFDDHIVPTTIEETNFRTILFALFLGGFLALIKFSGGQEGFSNWIARYATTGKSTQLACVFAGVGLFFDDYSSALILGASFKKLTDKFYISREKLAFVVDSTAAPISSIAPISSWIGFELSRIKPELKFIKEATFFEEKAADLPGEYVFFLNTLPSRYYPWFMIVIQLTLIAAGVEFGPMLFAERKTRIDKRTDGGDGAIDTPAESDLTKPEVDTPRKAYNFFVPLAFFIISLLWSMVNLGIQTLDKENNGLPEANQTEKTVRNIFGAADSFFSLVYTTMGASLFALVFYVLQTKKDNEIVFPTRESIRKTIDCRLKSMEEVVEEEDLLVQEKKDEILQGEALPLMQFTEGVNVWVEGFKNLVPAIIVLALAFTIKSIVKGCGTDRFFTEIILNGDIEPENLPTIIFFVSALLSFCTGTSFGTMSIMFPLVSFATWEKSGGDEKLYTVAMSSILAGSIFGDHSSLIADTTILSSIGAGCSIGTHVLTQLPYAIWGGIFAMLIGTLPAGAGANPLTLLIFGCIILSAATLLVAAPITSRTGGFDPFTQVYIYLFKGVRQEYEAFKQKSAKFAQENPDFVDLDIFALLTRAAQCCRIKQNKEPSV